MKFFKGLFWTSLFNVLLVMFVISCFSEQVYVKKDAVLEKKPDTVSFEVTQDMKNNVLAMQEEITKHNVKVLLKSKGSEAQTVIDELEADGEILTKEARYNILYPALIELIP